MEKLDWFPPDEPISDELVDLLAKTMILLQTDVSGLGENPDALPLSLEVRTEAYALLVELQEQGYRLSRIVRPFIR